MKHETVRQQIETALEENKNKFQCWWHFVQWHFVHSTLVHICITLSLSLSLSLSHSLTVT